MKQRKFFQYENWIFSWSLLCALCVLCGESAAADWYHWRGPQQTGVSPEKDLPDSWSADPNAANSNLVWKAPYGCRSTLLVMNGRVYIINYAIEKKKELILVKGKNEEVLKDNPETIQERVMCLDADTGKVLWEHKFNVFHTDIVTVRLGWTNLAGDPKTGNIYAHGTQGLFFCFDKDGKVLWSRSLTEEYGRISGYGGRVTSPTVDEDLVIVGMLNSSWGDMAKGGNRWLAMNKLTGQVVWWSEPGGQPKDTYYSVPVVATINGERLLISGGASGNVVAMKVRTGEKVWSYTFGTGAVNSSPVVDGNYIYIGHGEESPDTNVQGRVICLDASKIKDGQPELVWKKDGLKARYASPVLDRAKGRLYYPDEIGKLFCLDAKTGKQLWKYSYGRNSRGSPLLADGKIYVGEVNSRFHILKPGDKKCVALHEHFFPSPDGVSDVEINGTPSAANGRVYFSTSEEIFCIGKKDATVSKDRYESPITSYPVDRSATHVQILPADVVVHPGDTVQFTLRLFDDRGRPLGAAVDIGSAKWLLPAPPPPPGAKTTPPALDGTIEAGKLSVSAKKPSQQGYVVAKLGELTAKARVRVAPKLPYKQDFEKIPDGAVPGGWVNTQGKFLVATVDGNKVLKKVNDKASPLIARGNAYIGLPTLKDYTIACDVLGTKKGDDLPDMGIIANRYTLMLAGNVQKLRIVSWDALPRIDQTISYPWQPKVWYRLKLTVAIHGDKALVRGKVWPRDEKEPDAWTVEVTDSRPNREGSPALYGYVSGILEGQPGNDIFYDNVVTTPNKK